RPLRLAVDVVGDVVEDGIHLDDAVLVETRVEEAAAHSIPVLVGVGDVVAYLALVDGRVLEHDDARTVDVDAPAVPGGAVLPYRRAHAGADDQRRLAVDPAQVYARARRRLVADDPGVAQDHVPGVEDPAGAPQARGAVAPDAGLAQAEGAAHVGDAPSQPRLVRQHLVLLDGHVEGVEGAGVVDAAHALRPVPLDDRVLDVRHALVDEAALEVVGAGLDEGAEEVQAPPVPDAGGLVLHDVDVQAGGGVLVHVDDRGPAVPAAAVPGQRAAPVVEVRLLQVDRRAGEPAVVGAHDVVREVDLLEVERGAHRGQGAAVGVPGLVRGEEDVGQGRRASHVHAGAPRAVLQVAALHDHAAQLQAGAGRDVELAE